jgi:hypothetical protein
MKLDERLAAALQANRYHLLGGEIATPIMDAIQIVQRLREWENEQNINRLKVHNLCCPSSSPPQIREPTAPVVLDESKDKPQNVKETVSSPAHRQSLALYVENTLKHDENARKRVVIHRTEPRRAKRVARGGSAIGTFISKDFSTPRSVITPTQAKEPTGACHFVDETARTKWRMHTLCGLSCFVPLDKKNKQGETMKTTKKRKRIPISHNDGYGWTAHGRKVIVKTKQPVKRHYFRCSHSGCEARKVVDSPLSDSDNDPEDLAIFYVGSHNHKPRHERKSQRKLESPSLTMEPTVLNPASTMKTTFKPATLVTVESS